MAAIKLSRKKLILYRERNILRLPIPSSLLPAATGLSSYLLREVKTVGADLQHWVGSHVQWVACPEIPSFSRDRGNIPYGRGHAWFEFLISEERSSYQI